MSKFTGLMISSDSHVIEPVDLWARQLPAAFQNAGLDYSGTLKKLPAHPGSCDPAARLEAMAVDGVSAEILYPTLAMDQFGISDFKLQEACFRVYNDWIIEFCSFAPDRLFGIATISTFDIGHAIKELHRCKEAGLRGAMLWQVPPADLSFSSSHYDDFWAAAQEANMPISLHILTGTPYQHGELGTVPKTLPGLLDVAVNRKLFYAASALGDLIGSGTLERFPGLKFQLVENETSWLPFILSQYDKYLARGYIATDLKLSPSEYFRRQIFMSFFNDPPVRWMFKEWGVYNCMWSNDFPHANSTWPASREVIKRDLGELSASAQERLLAGNVSELYDLPAISPVSVGATEVAPVV